MSHDSRFPFAPPLWGGDSLSYALPGFHPGLFSPLPPGGKLAEFAASPAMIF
jgi:hypothetical protein